MRIAICASVLFAEKIREVEFQLKELGHEVILPKSLLEHNLNNQADAQSLRSREDYITEIKPRYTREHFNEIVKSDAILVVNEEKNGIPNYIGGATFAEIMLAFHYNKKIFFLNPIPKHEKLASYIEEIMTVKPVVINGELSLIK